MIMAELHSTQIDKTGIWQGMSGSPVYSEDGRLIGAVSYGLAFGPSEVAGITPAADMQALLDGGVEKQATIDAAKQASRVEVTSKQATAIAQTSDVSTAQADNGFARLRMPLLVSGNRARLNHAAKALGMKNVHAVRRHHVLGRCGPVGHRRGRQPRGDRVLRRPDQRRHRHRDGGLRRPGRGVRTPDVLERRQPADHARRRRAVHPDRPDAGRLQGREHHGACRLDPRRPPRRHLRCRRHGPRHHDGERSGLDRGGRAHATARRTSASPTRCRESRRSTC